MTVGELVRELIKFPPNMEVMTKKLDTTGNVGKVFTVKADSYRYLGKEVPCILLTDTVEDKNAEETKLMDEIGEWLNTGEETVEVPKKEEAAPQKSPAIDPRDLFDDDDDEDEE